MASTSYSVRWTETSSGIRHRVEPAAYAARVQQFIADYQVGTDNNMPVVEPPPGSHIYLQAQMWAWMPVLQLREGTEYILHLSSIDVNHGFGLFPLNVNFQVVPGYDYALDVTPTEPGEFRIVCNEFCGAAHHIMIGRIIVVEAGSGGEQ